MTIGLIEFVSTENNERVWINPEKVEAVQFHGKARSVIRLSADVLISVIGTTEEVAERIQNKKIENVVAISGSEF